MARRKFQSKSTTVHFSSTPTLALSNFHLRLQSLDEEHQWLLKQIRRKQTELKNFLEQMQSLAREIMQQGEPFYQQLIQLDREIHSLFAEIFQTRKFGKQSLQRIKGVYRNLQMMGIISPKIDPQEQFSDPFADLRSEFFAEEGAEFNEQEPEEGFADYFADESQSASRSSESKHIRQTFLRLAAVFHPDKVTDTETQKHYNEIMKEVNRAYNEGDIARLLEIEKQHNLGDLVAIETESLSEIEKRCQQRETENQLLKTQYENLKQELRSIRNSPEGATVKEFRACKRQGLDPIKEMLSEIEEQVAEITEIRDFVKDFRYKKITIKRFLEGPSEIEDEYPDDLDEILAQMIGELVVVQRF